MSEFKFPKPGQRKNKYGAKRVTGKNGQSYASMLERNYRAYLDLLEKAGLIRDIEEQPSVDLDVCKYKADFKYYDIENKETIWVDTKGVITDRFRLIMKIWKKFGPGKLHVVVYKYRNCTDRFTVSKEIIPDDLR